MTSSLTAEQFEQLVQRIYRTLKTQNAEVTWNARLPDDDVPGLLRQIDVLLRDSGKLIVVECRHHDRPQDVQWIELLSAKRISVNADAIIAVSSSGFTKNAGIKARSLGIITRTLGIIHKDEIASWANFENIKVNYVEFTSLVLDIEISQEHRNRIKHPHNVRIFGGQPGVRPLVDQLALAGVDRLRKEGPHEVRGMLSSCDMSVDGMPIIRCHFSATLRHTSRLADVPAVFEFSDLNADDSEVAVVQRSVVDNTEVISAERGVSWTIDLSGIRPPNNCVYIGNSIGKIYLGEDVIVNLIADDGITFFGDFNCRINCKFVAGGT